MPREYSAAEREAVQLRTALARRRALTDPLKAYCPQTPTAKQAAFLATTDLEVMYGGAGGGGKSSAILMGGLQYVHVARYSALILRRTYGELSQAESLMDRAKEWLLGSPAPPTWNENKKVFTFPSGATLQFGFLATRSDKYRYRSAEFQYIGFDELTTFEEDQYTYLFSRLRRAKGVDAPLRMRSATNPGGRGHSWVKARWDIPETVDTKTVYRFTPPQKPNGEQEGVRVFLPATLDENAHIDAEEYEESLAKLDPITREQIRYGRWVRDGHGLVYIFTDQNLVSAAPSQKMDHVVLGVDFGVKDACAWSAVGWNDGDPNVYVLGTYKEKGLLAADAAARTSAFAHHYRAEKIVGDEGGMGKVYAEEARRRFYIPMEAVPKTAKAAYIKLFCSDLGRGLLKVVRPACADLLAEWNDLPWNSDHTREADGFPADAADATLYAWKTCRAFHAAPKWTPPEERKPKVGSEAWRKLVAMHEASLAEEGLVTSGRHTQEARQVEDDLFGREGAFDV